MNTYEQLKQLNIDLGCVELQLLNAKAGKIYFHFLKSFVSIHRSPHFHERVYSPLAFWNRMTR